MRWSYDRFKSDETARMRYIVQMTLNLLAQIKERDIANPAFFESSVEINDDQWYAFQLSYLWDHLLPNLENIWYSELVTEGKPPEGRMFSFPFSRAEVNWAFMNYVNASNFELLYYS